MKRLPPISRLKTALSSLPLALTGLFLALSLTGCPGGADLENPERFPQLSTATGGTGAGGMGTAGMGTAATSSGGMGTGGTGMAGTGTGGSGVTQPLVVDCDYAAVLNTCATLGCHTSLNSSGLNLTPDDGLVARLKDQPAQHMGIYCGLKLCDTQPSDCKDALLVNSADPDSSWLLLKLQGQQGNCGDQMPAPGGPPADQMTCLDHLVRAIAALN